MRTLCFCILFLILPVNILGQQYNFKTYSVEHGLAQSQVLSICQDSKGNLWLGTLGGLNKFDGVTFTNFTTKEGLSSNEISSILEDREGNLWFGTDAGINKFDGATFTKFTTEEGLSSNIMTSILEDREGNLWFGTQGGGLNKFDGNTFTNFTTKEGMSNNSVSSICEDREGNLWIGTNSGVNKFDGETFKIFTTEDGLSSNIVWSILEDRGGNLWFGSHRGGICKFDGKTFTNFTTKDGLSNNLVLSILEDWKGNLWCGTYGGGVSKFDGRTFTNFTKEEGLSCDVVWSILEDREGNIWFGTDGGGFCKYSGEAFINFSEKEGLSNNLVMSILEDHKGNLWFGTDGGGVNKYNGKTFTIFSKEDGLSSNSILSILEDRKGNLWFGTYRGGVNKYDGNTFTIFTKKEGLSHNIVLSIFEDKEGNLWFGTNAGVSKFDGVDFTNFTTEDGLSHSSVSSIFEDKDGNLWFCTGGGGVDKYDGATFTNFNKKDGLSDNNIISILQDQEGNLWFGTAGGITRFVPPQEGEVGSFEIFTTDDGLFDDNISLMVFDDAGNLWIGTNKGVDKFDVPGYNKTGKRVFRHYGKEEGFVGIECNHKAACKDSKGNIWFGTINGVTKYNPEEDALNTIEPLTYINNLSLFFEDIDWSNYADSIDNATSLPIGLRLPYNKNHMTFDFIGICLTIPKKVRYQYKLEGFDKDWSPVTKEDHITYSNLSPGEYTFEVKACNNDGLWNKESTAFSFVVAPPFWQTWLFRIIVIILVITSIYGVFRFKTAQLRNRAKVLEQKVDERTAELRETQKMLVDTAHRAGMAEIASGILHNVGNVLNSVKVSSQILKERVERSKINSMKKALSLMEQHSADLGDYITSDEKGKMLPEYLVKVGKTLKGEQDNYLKELSNLHSGLDHIEEIVTVQQNYAGVSGVVESVSLSKMMDDVLRMYRDSFVRNKIKAIKNYKETPPISVEKGKLMQVFVNLLKNSQESLIIKGDEEKVIKINILEDEEKKSQIVEIIDNGVGINKDNLNRIFSYGFTTKKGGQGLGLHTSALSMAELNGKIFVHSDGEDMGAKFTVIVSKNKC